jgi:hypothetical protein
MTALVAPATSREIATFAWCPTCQGPRACSPSQGTTDWQTIEVYTCRSCGRVTHDPLIRLTTAADAPPGDIVQPVGTRPVGRVRA